MSTSLCRCNRLFVEHAHRQTPINVYMRRLFAKCGNGSHTNARHASGYSKKPPKLEDRIGMDYRDKASLNGLQLRFLVWTGRFDKLEDIPDKIRVDTVGHAVNTMFLLGYSWYLMFFVVALYILISMWKREWQKGVESELRKTVEIRTNEPSEDYEIRFQKVLKKDIQFMRSGYEKYGPDMALWLNEDSELDAKKFNEQREIMREKHLDADRKRAMQQYAADTDSDWEKRMEQQLKIHKK